MNFSQIYAAVLVWIMQQICLRNELLKSQTLTATHDKTTAWDGLGSAAISLWRQKYIRASPWGTLSITTYFGLIAVLHNTTPALLGLEAFNATVGVETSTRVGVPLSSVGCIYVTPQLSSTNDRFPKPF
jgi:hypothetical protein